jgi:hypothetical protein
VELIEGINGRNVDDESTAESAPGLARAQATNA